MNFGLNKLSGKIPDAMGSMRSLEFISLNINRLSGAIPVAMAFLAKLVEFSASDNRLCGSIPFDFISHVFYVNDNHLTGTLSNFERCRALTLVEQSPPPHHDKRGADSQIAHKPVHEPHPSPQSIVDLADPP